MKKTCGPDNISPKLIWSCITVLIEPLSLIFNSCIKSSTFPDDFKIAKIIPLYKQLEKNIVDNYRPISLLNCFSKIFERLIHKQLINFLQKHALLYQYQYGFRQSHSTTLALIEIVDGIKSYIDKGEIVIGSYLDLEKAFDTVNHPILFAKLEHYGIRGAPLDFFKSYLCNRKQYVRCNNTSSYTTKMTMVYPKAQCLGLYFLSYMSMTLLMRLMEKWYAYLQMILQCLSKVTMLVWYIMTWTKGLIQLKEWFSCNRLTLILAKTCYSIYRGPNKTVPRLYDTMALKGQIINRQSCVKYLGLTNDDTFNWGQHVSNLAKSLSKYYGIFNKIHLIPKRHKMTMFNSFVHSKICYGIEIYGSLNDCLCKRLQIICNKLLKFFFNKNPLYGTNQLHKELNILKVKDVYKALI